MQVNSVNNQSFGARIKISKAVKADLMDGAALSSLGTSASGIGTMSSVPLADPAHHVLMPAKVVDSAFALIGSTIAGIGANCMRRAGLFFKSAMKNSKIPS